MKYKRILIKLSGEALAGDNGFGIDFERVLDVCREIKEINEEGSQVAIVVGGGNFWRGRSNTMMDRCTSDYIGMLGTTMNALALRDAFTKADLPNVIFSPFDFHELIEYHSEDELKELYKNGTVVVFSGGTGHIGCSTDTAASMKAIMIGADVIIKLTNVDGVYDKDPNKHDDATKIDEISYMDVLNKNIKVMDSTAMTLSMDNDIPIVVFDINKKGDLKKVVNGKKVGTIVSNN